MKRKRYWLFVSDVYYPSGGMNDYHSDFDTMEEVLNFCNTNYDKYVRNFKIAEVFDSETYNYEPIF